ncbi:hypothetical protein DICPUDRAFT_155048 [Dictyostelium purpureum]|uniref:Exportin-T n=1 Tax=Dictyostelium purpureum TaxID=5786 RepID=F0ZSY2_DICPU|nr:uncharacterized protein DICPUDRAFT_155048 [Dictyostelium purpureum]EGC32961.1 hypothetical protein DICPUDRAFT_155048 [Dictyostelium purpureum]|eukprot:XP_003290527.1 hypothetical protein DICPUDRAFT_155048 [Dictyostelium purpureum]
MDNFDQAVICSFDPSTREDIKQQALEYTNRIKENPKAWEFCLEKLRTTNNTYIKFFCIQVFQDIILHKYELLTTEDKLNLRVGLLKWFQSHLIVNQEETPIKNKFAQIIVLLFKQEYPDGWPAFFEEILSLLNLQNFSVDIFLRICKSIDEEVVSFDVHRSPAELAQNTMIKDKMREKAIVNIVSSWYEILTKQKNSSLINMTLQNIKTYVGWIDINLIVNDPFIQVFCNFLREKSVREEVVDCFKEIINKGMDPMAKLTLIQQLRIKDIIGLTSLDSSEFVVKVGNLVNLTGMEILRGMESLQQDPGRSFSNGEILLNDMLQILVQFFNNESNDVSYSVYGFASLYVQKLKGIKNISGQQFEHIRALVQIVRNKMRFKTDKYDDEDDSEIKILDFRKDLSNLFRNIFRIRPDLVSEFVTANISNILTNPGINYSDIEVSIYLLFQMGEGISANSEESMKQFEKFFSEMISNLAISNISQTSHQVVSLMYFETLVRYAKYIPLDSRLDAVIKSFLDARGIYNSDPVVRSKAGHLFNKLVKQLKVPILKYINDIIIALQNHLIISYEIQKVVPFDEQSSFYELLGFLIGAAILDKDTESGYIQKILGNPINQLKEIIDKQLYKTDTKENQFYSVQICQLISVIGNFSKGFSSFNASNGAPKPDSLCHYKVYFKSALTLIVQLPNLLPENEEVKFKTFFYMHRMVECLGKDLKPLLEDILPLLLSHTVTIPTLLEFLVFINQLVGKYKEELFQVINHTLKPTINHVFKLLNPSIQPPEHSDEERSINELKRSYYQFIQGILSNNLANTFTSQANLDVFEKIILPTLTSGCQSSNEAIQKACFVILKKMIDDYAPGGAHHINGFEQFLFGQMVPLCFEVPLSPQFNINDFASNQIILEIGKSLKSISSKYGDNFLNFLKNSILPKLNVTSEFTDQFLKLLLPTAQVKEFQECLKLFIRTRKGKIIQQQLNSNGTTHVNGNNAKSLNNGNYIGVNGH